VGAYSAPPYPLAVLKEPTFKVREGSWQEDRRGGEGKVKGRGCEQRFIELGI